MPLDERDAGALWDALQAAKDVVGFAAGMSLEEYASNKLVQAAVERKLITIGEALRRVSNGALSTLPELPVAAIIGLRNVVAHQYDRVNHETNYDIATVRMADFISLIEKTLPPAPADPEPEP